jgi:hypothetical protein
MHHHEQHVLLAPEPQQRGAQQRVFRQVEGSPPLRLGQSPRGPLARGLRQTREVNDLQPQYPRRGDDLNGLPFGRVEVGA